MSNTNVHILNFCNGILQGVSAALQASVALQQHSSQMAGRMAGGFTGSRQQQSQMATVGTEDFQKL